MPDSAWEFVVDEVDAEEDDAEETVRLCTASEPAESWAPEEEEEGSAALRLWCRRGWRATSWSSGSGVRGSGVWGSLLWVLAVKGSST